MQTHSAPTGMPLLARLKSFLTGGFARNVATLAGGAAVAQFLPLLLAPLLTRLYSPAEFGVLAIYIAWLSNLAVLATARYELAIVLPEDSRRAANLMGLAIGITFAVSLLSALVMEPGSEWLAARAGEPALAPWLRWLPLSLCLSGLMQAWANWNNRHERYKANASGRMAQAVSMMAVQVGCGLAGFATGGLVMGQMAGQAASLVVQAWRDLRERFGFRHQVSLAGMRSVAREYAEFPRVNAPHAFVAALQDTLTVTLLTVLSGSTVVGLFGLMMRVLKLPAALVGQAVAQVTYRDLAAARNEGRPLVPLLKKSLVVLLLLSLIPFGIILGAGDILFAFVFGESWRDAGRYAQALAPYILFHFIASPLGMVPLVIDRQRIAFAFTVVGSVLFLGCIAAGNFLWNDLTAACWLTSAVMSVYFITYFVWLFRAAR